MIFNDYAHKQSKILANFSLIWHQFLLSHKSDRESFHVHS